MIQNVEGTGAPAPVSGGSRPSRRQQWEHAQRQRSIVIATLSTAVVVGLLLVLVPMAPGWDKVKASFFDADTFRQTFPGLARAFWYDVQIFLWCAPSIVVVALVVAVARNVRSPALFPVRLFATLYTDIVRGVPVILWIYLFGFGVPGLIQSREWGRPIIWGSVALIMSYSAYVSEVFRAGIESVHESQRAAARSLGLSSTQTMRHVVLPQALRRVVPPFMNDMVSLQKDVALISVIGPIEVLRQAGIDKANFANFTPYVGAALLFLLVSIPLTRFTDHLLQRERRLMSGTAVR
jgi:polar amino acid transport system permease protein